MIFTVLTPTFNRAHTLERLYNSLQRQTLKEFEWLVIDDGSNDNTQELIENWSLDTCISIKYHFQPNSGKHVAVNLGVQLAKGCFTIIADSDDEFLPNSLQNLIGIWNDIPSEKRSEFTGITGLCVDSKMNLIGKKFHRDIVDTTPAEMYYIHSITGDKVGFHRTSVLRQYPFPELKNYSFFAESIIWNRIGRVFKTRYVNIPLRIVHTDAGNHLTNNHASRKSKNAIFYFYMLNEDADYFMRSPFKLFKHGMQAIRFSLHQSEKLHNQFMKLEKGVPRFIWAFSIPFGFVLFWKDKATDYFMKYD